MPRRLLITGGAGFIGSNFARYWCETAPGDRIVVLDALTYAGNRANLAELELDGRLRLVQGGYWRSRPSTIGCVQQEQIDTIAPLLRAELPTLTA
ncbi:MAG: NAD-dependent epimerase/dehydratase family protein, partial [Spirulinaceae cyanobacterium RM2_2_10]|nr:NAD-dependent epimerase/dehydratase family protein [Spirulinaceae cyanobacterium RM2_2_10]